MFGLSDVHPVPQDTASVHDGTPATHKQSQIASPVHPPLALVVVEVLPPVVVVEVVPAVVVVLVEPRVVVVDVVPAVVVVLVLPRVVVVLVGPAVVVVLVLPHETSCRQPVITSQGPSGGDDGAEQGWQPFASAQLLITSVHPACPPIPYAKVHPRQDPIVVVVDVDEVH